MEDVGDDEGYPYYIFFILGNEFCERYAYYGMRSILVIFLTYFLGFDKDTSTVIYHTFAALCYFFPLVGGIIADSYLGKFKTIFSLSILYFFGMVMMAVSAIPQLNEGLDKPGSINDILAMVALLVIAIGTGGIKPCVSALGGDQFKDTPKGQERLSAFFSLFYASINAGSLLSTFISPILRETSCFNRSDCYFIAFIVPAALMLVAIIAFFCGRNYYVIKKPSGNVFATFLKATWNGLRNSCKSKEKKDHFLDHCDPVKYPAASISDFKYVYPVIVMYLPIPFYRALAEMQGSRFVLTATQMDGWMGTALKIKPDQMQILNPLMILAFLPLFQYGVYPLMEKCGIAMTPLRRMSAGQLITAVAFLVAGFVQLKIDDGLTPIPDYGSQNSLMVTNGYYNQELAVSSDYWKDIESNENETTSFLLNDEVWRTPTFDWIKTELPAKDTEITIGDVDFNVYDFNVEAMKIASTLCYSKDDADTQQSIDVCEPYYSPVEKSGSIKVRSVLLNPTNYCANFRLVDLNDPTEDMFQQVMNNDTTVQPYSNSIDDDTEFERGIYKIVTRLWTKDSESCPELDTVPDIQCETGYIQNGEEGDFVTTDPDAFKFQAGSIWTFMVTTDDNECRISYDEDSTGNTVNIFLLFPQYFVITVGEVMNSVTGLEFSYTQAPKSMKSVVQSFWLLTTCIGNIIDVFLVKIKIAPTQAGEYFALSLIMVGATGIFVLLSMFYYDYVPEGTFLDNDEIDVKSIKEDEKEKKEDIGVENVALETEKNDQLETEKSDEAAL